MAENGFIIVPRAVIDAGPKVGSLAFHVYAILAAYANDAGECWPSRELIAEKTGMSLRSVVKQIGVLKEHGIIEVRNRTGGITPRSNLYTILAPYLPNAHEVPIQTRTKCTPNAHEMHPKRAQNDISNAHEVHKNKNQELNPRTKPKELKGADASVLIPDSLRIDSFLSKWSDYTKHRKELRKPLTPTSAKAALAKLEAMGPTTAVEALTNSISNGWQGVFPPTESKPSPTSSKKRYSKGCVYDPNATG